MPFIKCFAKRRRLFPALCICLLGATAVARADFPNPQPYPEVRYERRLSLDPPQQIYSARIDLSDPDVDVRVAPGGPDGTGEYETTLQTPSTIADRERFEIAVNGDFFTARKTTDVEGTQSGYVSGKWAKALGPAVSDGYLWAPASEPRAALILDVHKHPRLATVQEVPADALQVIAGSNIIVQEGKTSVANDSSFARTRHPRTAVGIADDGKTLVLVVVDGRRPKEASGMSLVELADLMQQLGCREAVNLDGGGSSELVMRNPADGKLQVMNRPSDGRERAVANVFGISIRGTRRTPILSPPTTQELAPGQPDPK